MLDGENSVILFFLMSIFVCAADIASTLLLCNLPNSNMLDLLCTWENVCDEIISCPYLGRDIASLHNLPIIFLSFLTV